MEGNVAKLSEEEFPDFDHLENLFRSVKPTQDDRDSQTPKTSDDLAGEEEKLKLYLDKLRKENFTLRSGIKAWQKTLKLKQEEFKEADLKLDEIYNEVWSEREKFCSKLDKFNDEFGVLSNWWEMQVKLISEIEKGSEGACRREIEKLETEVAKLKKEMEELQGRKCVPEVQMVSTVHCDSVRKESTGDDLQETVFSGPQEETGKSNAKRQLESDLYSLVDVEKVKMAKKRRKNCFFNKQKNPQTINTKCSSVK